jgi:hypothetical protein
VLRESSKRPPRINDKNNQGENPKGKSSIPMDEGAIHFISLLPFNTLLILVSHHNPHGTSHCSGALHIIPEDSRTFLFQ